MTAFSRTLLAFALAPLVLAASASGYELKETEDGKPLWWSEMPVEYRLVAGNVPEAGPGEAAVQRAFDTWERASSNVAYEFGGVDSEGTHRFDSKNVVYWIHENWPYDERAAALTFHYYDRKDGHLLDADVVFNGEGFEWSIGGAGFDIENAAAHEVGHFGGLGHSDRAEATMFSRTSNGETGKRTLAADDVQGLDALYGGTSSGTSETGHTSGAATGLAREGGSGGCSIAPREAGGESRDLVPLALFFAALAVRRYRPRQRRES